LVDVKSTSRSDVQMFRRQDQLVDRGARGTVAAEALVITHN